MSLETRIGRMETKFPAVRFVRIDARDEADSGKQIEDVILSSFKTPGRVDLEIHVKGEVTRRQIIVPPFEDALELLD